MADAYLAGYVNFLADTATVQRPAWTNDPKCIASVPWFSSLDRKRLMIISPVSLREKNRLRQQRYRARAKEQLVDYYQLKKQEGCKDYWLSKQNDSKTYSSPSGSNNFNKIFNGS